MIKGEFAAVGGKTPKDRRKLRMLKRIHEYEKFVENCQRYKEFDRERKNKGKIRRHTLAVIGTTEIVETELRKWKSLDFVLKEKQTWNERYSVPLMLDYNYKLSLTEKILFWQSKSEDLFLEEDSVPIEVENV